MPGSVAAVFEWQHMLSQPTKRPGRWRHHGHGRSRRRQNNGQQQVALFCKRCMHTQPDPRGGVKLHSVFVSRLPLSVKAEDVHATFDDHFGFVHHVVIPKDATGKPKVDKDGFAYGQVYFYRRGGARTPKDADEACRPGLATTARKALERRNLKQTGQMAALHAGWCWAGDGNGRRCRVHHVVEQEEAAAARHIRDGTSTDAASTTLALPIGPVAVRSRAQLSANDAVRTLSAQHGGSSRESHHRESRVDLDVDLGLGAVFVEELEIGKTTDAGLQHVAQETRDVLRRESKEKHRRFERAYNAGFIYTQSFSSYQLAPAEAARQCAMHDDVPGLKRLMRLNEHSVKADVKRRRVLFDPYSERYALGRTLLHIVAVHGSTGVLELLLSDKTQAVVMTTRARQQRAAHKEHLELEEEHRLENEADVGGGGAGEGSGRRKNDKDAGGSGGSRLWMAKNHVCRPCA